MKYIVLSAGFFIPCALLAGSGCCKKPGASGDGPSESAGLQLVEANADKRLISAARGGVLAASMPGGGVAQVLIPGKALAVDTNLELVPLATAPTSKGLVPGFAVRKAGDTGPGAHVKLAVPAMVTVLFKGNPPANAGIVRYSDDGSQTTPVKTSVKSDGKIARLTARVDSFSAFGAKELTPDEQKAADTADAAMSPVAFTIFVDGTINKTVDVWSFDYHVKFQAHASASSPDWSGPATVTVKGKATKNASGMFARVKIDSSYSGEARFSMFPTLTPLVPPKGSPDPALVPLTPTAEAGYEMGKGSLVLKGTGSYDAFGTGGGATLAKKDSVSGSESVPMTVGMKVEEGQVWVVLQGVGSVQGTLLAIAPLAPGK